MKPQEAVKLLEERVFILAILNLLFLISPGIAAIFFFRNELFIQLDWAKLALMAMSITSPLTLWNTFLFAILDDTPTDNLYPYFSMGTILSGLIIYAVLLITYFFDTSLREDIGFVALLEVLALILLALRDEWQKRGT